MLDLQPIKSRLAAATPGPWWSARGASFGTYFAVAVVGNNEVRTEQGNQACSDNADADLIAHAPTDLAALVAEVERFREAIAEHRQALLPDGTGMACVEACDRRLWAVLDA